MRLLSLFIFSILFCFSQSVFSQSKVDLVVVFKSDNMLYLFSEGKIVKNYDIGLGYNPKGDKKEQGDYKTPEGQYTLDWRNPNSKFYKSIHISYPNEEDIAYAKKHGLNTGGDIMIHGQPVYDNRKRTGNWTHGCIAVSNSAIDQIWQLVDNGTPIHIYP